MMKKFSSRFKESIPHITLILSLMLTVFLIVDQFNRAMAFINNDITKFLMLIASVLALVLWAMHRPIINTYVNRKRLVCKTILLMCGASGFSLITIFFLNFEVMVINTTTVKTLIAMLVISLTSLSVMRIVYQRDQQINPKEIKETT